MEVLQPGDLVRGRYQIVEALASGGQGFVYLAIAQGAAGFAKPVVVKRTHGSLPPEERALLAREARVLARLRHPKIITVLDLMADDEGYMAVFDFVKGYHLGKWLKYLRRKATGFRVDFAVLIVLDVLDALAYAHADNVIHRDVTPANILLDVDGNVKLADFGIARAGRETTDASGKSVRGNFPYVAPEVFQGADPSRESDIYSVGLVLYQLLTGRNPIKGSTVEETVTRALTFEPEQLHVVRPDVPAHLSQVVAKCYEKEHTDRWSDAKSLADELRSAVPMDEREVRRQVREQIHRDFRSDDFAVLANAMSLERIEALLEREPAAIPVHVELSERISSLPPTQSLDPQPRKPRWLFVLAAILLVGAALAAGYLSQSKPPQRHFVVVSGAERTEAIGDAVADSGAATNMEAGDTGTPVMGTPAAMVKMTGALSQSERLTRVMRRRNPAIQRCVRASSVRSSELSIRITVDRSGDVAAANVLPARFQDTELGVCLRQVALETRFPPQPDTVTFRVPVRISGAL